MTLGAEQRRKKFVRKGGGKGGGGREGGGGRVRLKKQDVLTGNGLLRRQFSL
jgi:hypothetical protein